jgi:hypothetical protein
MSSGGDERLGAALPAATRWRLGPVVRRAMHTLPEPMLVALARGLRKHRDELAPGRLFAAPRAGGCAVGIALRELAPQAFEFRSLPYWLWHRRRRGVERDVALRFPELTHLQSCFDDAVAETLVGTALGRRAAAREVGLWFAGVAEAELSRRRPRAIADREPEVVA